MIQNKQSEQLTKIGNLISSRLDKYESLIFIVFIVGLILKITTDLDVGILIVISLTTLAILYFLNAYANPDHENIGGLEIFTQKLASIGLSVATIGILFRIENWPGFNFMIMCGCLTSLISLLMILIYKSKKPDLRLFNNRLIIRIVIIILSGLVLYLTPTDALIKYRLLKEIKIEKTE